MKLGVSTRLDTPASLFPVEGLKYLLKIRVSFAETIIPKLDAFAVTGTFETVVSTRLQMLGKDDCRATVSTPLTVPVP
jgi:hypothetical protein